MDKTFRIGDFTFRLRWPDSLRIPENFLKFACEGEAVYTYDLDMVDSLPAFTGRVLARREDLTVLSAETGEIRYIGVKGNPEPYGCYREVSASSAQVTLLTSWAAREISDPGFVSLLALEKRMLERSALVLHTAFMVYKGQAVLFSAPSGTGKSTQADLWEKYRGSRTINGDRCLLRKQNGIWQAEGWPVCGSSQICNRGSWPVRAIVMLDQAKENSIERLTPAAAFAQVYSQITVNRWDKRAAVSAMDRIEELTEAIPVYHLACNISEQAVACLERALEEDSYA